MISVLSPEFAEYANRAECRVGTSDGLEAVWTQGGEIQFSLDVDGSEVVIVRSERSGAPRQRLRTGVGEVAERYLTAEIGVGLRSQAGYGMLLFLHAIGDLTPRDGYEVVRFNGGYIAVESETGSHLGKFASEMGAVSYTFYADAPLDLMRESFCHPEGEPLFRDAWQRWQDRATPKAQMDRPEGA